MNVTDPSKRPYTPWTGDMVPRAAGPGKRIERSGGGGYSSSSTVRLEWASRRTDAGGEPLRVRKPLGVPLFFPAACFMAAGRPYLSLSMLTARREEGSPWAKDVYGRDVLVLTERFPCFDSADRKNERRYFRWYFLCHKGRLTRVYHTDKTPTVTVTEDVRDLEEDIWEQMQALGCFGPQEETAPPAPPAPAPAPAKPLRWSVGSMVPRETGPGENIEHSGGGYICCKSVRLEWVSRRSDAEGKPYRVRTPESRTEIMPKNAFTAAGKEYTRVSQLVARWEEDSWATDRYGRFVLMVAERFPCFDSSDYLYEDRYFRWFLLCLDGKFTCVYHTDGTDTVTVTEDVLDLEEPCWKEINKLKCFERDETDA